MNKMKYQIEKSLRRKFGGIFYCEKTSKQGGDKCEGLKNFPTYRKTLLSKIK